MFAPLLKNKSASRHMTAHLIAATAFAAVRTAESGTETATSFPPADLASELRQAATAQLTLLDLKYPDVHFKLALGSLLSEAGDLKMSDGYYTMVLQEDSTDRVALFSLGSQLSRAAASARRGRLLLERYLKLYAPSLGEGEVISAELFRGQSLLATGDYGRATRVFREVALRLQAGSRPPVFREAVYASMADAFREAGAPAFAREGLALAITGDVEGSPSLWAAAGAAYLAKGEGKSAKKARELFADALLLSPENKSYAAAVHVAAAIEALDKKMAKEAAAEILKASELTPDDASVFYYKARILEAAGERSGAEEALAAAGRLSPEVLKKACQDARLKAICKK